MNTLINTISAIIKIIGYRSSRELSYFLDKLVTSVAILTLACIFVFIGLLFIVWAIYLSFNSILSPPLAALVSGSITIIFSILILLIIRLFNRRKEKRVTEDNNIENISLKDFPKNITLVKENPLLSIVLTIMAGYLIGSSPSARNAAAEVIVKVLDQHLKTKKSKD
jgi:glycerol-3-phosphate acyltransferase PlsY